MRLRLAVAFSCVAALASLRAETRVTDLRAGGWTNPLGLDDPQPVLSWRLESDARGAGQTAAQILVATRPDLLVEGSADLWDSGRLATDSPLGAHYAGQPLRSALEVFWRVRVWDEQGRPSAWSEPARWITGQMDPNVDPGRSPWITDPGLAALRRAKRFFQTPETSDPARAEWIQVDLGESRPIEMVRLHAVRHSAPERYGFPRRFRIEVSDDPSMRGARTLLDHTDKDFPNSWANVIRAPGHGLAGRYVRVTATLLRTHAGKACFALSQLEVVSGGRNVAARQPVEASDSEEGFYTSLAAAVDGLGAPGGNPRANDTLRLRREFTVRPGLRRAVLFVSGLGHYTLAVNGTPVGAARLTPGWSAPGVNTVYDTHELTALLSAGRNALGLTVAGGMHNVAEGRYVKFVTPFRPLIAWAELHLEYADGSKTIVPTGTRWRVRPGPTTFANVYGGEDHDARLETPGWDRAGFDDRDWTPAAAFVWPGASGTSRAGPPILAQEELAPASVKEIRPGVEVYDFGQNAAMMPRLRVSGPAGATVRLVPAELLRADGTVDRRNVGGDAWWQYTLRGDPAGETWEPSFFYHGARYLQVERSAPAGGELPKVAELASIVVHSAAEPVGEFTCSNELLNRIYGLVRWAQRSNLMHVLTDCPHRERLGWLEQYHLNGPALRYNWDLTRLYRRAFHEMVGAQSRDGLIPSTAPELVIFPDDFRDSPEWGSALILAAWQHWRWTGDDSPLRQHYAAMERYLGYLQKRRIKGAALLNHGLGDWYDLGPNRPGVAQLTPVALTASGIYFEDARVMERIARRLGRAEDAVAHQKTAEQIRRDFNARFLDRARGIYATGSQTAQAMPLVLGLVPDEHRASVLAALVADIEQRGHAHTAGDVGYRYVLRALADAGRSDLVYRLINQTEKPGYGYQLARGATSLTEAWDADPRVSQNHFMLGQINEWFFHDLAGIQPGPDAAGFRDFVLAPAVIAGLDHVRAAHRGPLGWIRAEWRRAEGSVTYYVTVPPGSKATVRLPVGEPGAVRESGVPLAEVPEVGSISSDGRATSIVIPAGSYRFSWPAR